MAETIVTLGAITFNDNTNDVNGAKWWVDKIDGWDSPSIRQSLFDLTGADGQAIAEARFRARPLVLSGQCQTSSQTVLDASRDRLADISQQLTAPRLLTVNETTAKQVLVVRAGELRMRDYVGAGAFDFELPLLAVDPRKYSTNQPQQNLDATSRPLVSNGTYPTLPILRVLGAATNPIIITNRGRSVRINTALSSTDVLTVDFARRLVLLNNVPNGGLIDSSTQWWNLTPGTNLMTYEQGSFEDPAASGVADWLGNNCRLFGDDRYADDGTRSMVLNSTTAGQLQATLIVGKRAPVVPTATYSAFASFRSHGGQLRNVHVDLAWYTSANAYISQVTSAIAAETSGAWTRRSVSGVAPATAAFAIPVPYIETSVVGEEHAVDRLGVFDGSPTDWTPGQANLVSETGGGTAGLSYRDAFI